VWGTAAGALFTWEPWDFGLRKAEVTGAEASVGKARASEALTRLDVQNAAGAAFLAVIAADRAVIAAQADFDRRDVLARRVRVLVDNELRPGAEASRALAERAAANTRLIQAGAARLLARASLTRLLGLTQGSITIEASGVLDAAPPPAPGAPAPAAHPLLQVHQTAIDAARAEVDVLARTDRPRLFVQSSVFARGSGANPSGPFAGGTDGLGFERANWAAGVQIQFPNVFDFASLGARRASAAASERAESALYDEALLSVSSQRQVAEMLVQAARAVAENTPVQRSAASQSEAQAKARYEAGLASIAEVADAQNLLAQAEYQDQLARVDVWRALLAQAAAGGTLTPFLELLRPPSGVR
jgi:outer membrane protein TolC